MIYYIKIKNETFEIRSITVADNIHRDYIKWLLLY
jgi:hypothetical protein